MVEEMNPRGGLAVVNGRKIVALCMSRLHDMENGRFVEALNSALFQAGYSLWVYHITADLYWQDEILRAETSVFDLIDLTRTDAIIYMDERIKSKRIANSVISRAQAQGVPVIVVDGSYEGCVSVRFDYGKGFEQVVQHVIGAHHARRLHYMGGIKGNPFSDEREAVFRRVLEEHGLAFDESMVSYGEFWAKPARAAAEALAAAGTLPDAIICANDIMAINVVSVLGEHGYSVPEDCIVTGFDGIDEIFFAEPSVTSARCGSRRLAQTVFRAVTETLDGREAESYLVEPELLLNASCGCRDARRALDRIHSFNDRFYRYQDDYKSLSEMCERMQICGSIEEAGWCLYNPFIYDMCCIVDKRCAERIVNLFEDTSPPDEQALVFFDTEDMPSVQYSIHRSEIIPHLEAVIEQGCPLIFGRLHFEDIPLGYVCFHFRDYDQTNYCKIPQLLTALSMGVGGFVNLQHQKYLRSQIENMYKFDSLTGLYTRLSFHKAFESFRESHQGERVKLTLVFSDLDGLKQINDSFGHTAGDMAIAASAEALKQACPVEALCARFGGDELLAVIPGECDGEAILARIRANFDEFNAGSSLGCKVSASLGLHCTELTEALSLEALLEKADAQMYADKQNRKPH